MSEVFPNPDLSVGEDNKQRWNQPAHRRHGFHNAHLLMRRMHMVRARNVLALHPTENPTLTASPEVSSLINHPAFSALVCIKGDQILLERHAADFSTTRPHSIQSISKMHIHLIVGKLVDQQLLDLKKTVGHYLPDIGSGYSTARVQDLLDMNVANDFSEDYADPHSDCYTEEIALGWRLPRGATAETTLRDFTNGITGSDLANPSRYADYKSANTDVLTRICALLSPTRLVTQIEAIADAAGYEGSFHISLSPDQLPAFSGGGCLSARDLARFGLLVARGGTGSGMSAVGELAFLHSSLTKQAPQLRPPKNWLRYSNHLMTDGRLIGHAGYGGQFLMVDTKHGISCAYLSVLENESGYDDVYMANVAECLRFICLGES
ncbi:MAG: beta-lactamase family protein [Rhodobacteraceae bacterium]|nr:beta-lactamase family protein [Paracoccaceae bacterium]